MNKGGCKCCSMLLVIVLLVPSVMKASVFTSSFGSFSDDRANGWGQTFTPYIGAIEPEGMELPQTVYLLNWTYKTSDSGHGQSEGDVYLAIFSAFDPYAMDSSNLVGVSSTSVDMAGVGDGVLVTWQFDGLALDKDTEYALMFSSTPDASGILQSQAVVLSVGNRYPGGGWIRVNDTANDWDAHYRATYSTGGFVIVSTTDTLALTTESPMGTYRIVLCGAPQASVDVTVTPMDENASDVDLGHGPAEPTTLHYPAFQSSAQPVTITAANLPIPGTLREVVLVHTVESMDVDYHNREIPEMVVSVLGDDPYCGQTGTIYLLGDLNQDCRVDIADLAIMADNWMKSSSAPESN